jgi:PTH1 family peptidyl-tRNA hydrolase
VAHDDLDIKLGEYKIQFGKGPKDHNGVKSVENVLQTEKFWRVRIGIDNRDNITPSNPPLTLKGGRGSSGEEYVLQKFLPEEKGILNQILAEMAGELLS